MLIGDVKNLPAGERLLYWVRERESLRLKKESGASRPWTDDDILSTYRFCNVRRADDRVSRWLLDHWYTPHHGHPNALLACALARWVNLPDSLGAVGFPERWDPARVAGTLKRVHSESGQVFNSAYVIAAGGKGSDKIDTVVDEYLAPLVKNPPRIDTSSMERTWEALREYRGYGSFMAGQVVADLRWATPGAWQDKDSWAPVGPGSARGMNRLHGRDVGARLSQERFLEELRGLMDLCRKELPSEITGRLEAADYQSVCCEWDKHERALWGGGRPKARYTPFVAASPAAEASPSSRDAPPPSPAVMTLPELRAALADANVRPEVRKGRLQLVGPPGSSLPADVQAAALAHRPALLRALNTTATVTLSGKAYAYTKRRPRWARTNRPTSAGWMRQLARSPALAEARASPGGGAAGSSGISSVSQSTAR